MSRSVRVRAPASSANLGPGFDVLAAALDLWVEVEVTETGRFAVDTRLRIARDRRNVCVRAFERVLDPSRFRFAIRSQIPLAGGLGSSAAAAVCGVLAARELGAPDTDVLAEAAAFEGHPDNAAAAVHGGFVACVGDEVARIPPPATLGGVIVVPRKAVRTKEARAALPGSVPIADAAFNVGQASALVLGLERGDLGLIAQGLGDRLHQPHRAHLFPRSAELLERATALGALGATISGAGPTVLLWCDAAEVEAVEREARRAAEGWAEVRRAPFTTRGATVLAA